MNSSKPTIEVKEYLQNKIAEEAGISAKEISFNDDFHQFTLDSLSILELAYDLKEDFGIDGLDPTVFIEFNTINKLDAWIQGRE